MMDPFAGCNKLREDSKLSFGQLHVIAWVDMESLFIGVDIGYNVSEKLLKLAVWEIDSGTNKLYCRLKRINDF